LQKLINYIYITLKIRYNIIEFNFEKEEKISI